jgi:hypothetical protein
LFILIGFTAMYSSLSGRVSAETAHRSPGLGWRESRLAFVLILLYPFCFWFAELKQRRPKRW